MPRHRRSVYDVATFAMRFNEGHEYFDAVHHAHKVDVYDPAPVFERDAARLSGEANAGVINNYMNLAESFDSKVGGTFDRLSPRHITDYGLDIESAFRKQRLRRV